MFSSSMSTALLLKVCSIYKLDSFNTDYRICTIKGVCYIKFSYYGEREAVQQVSDINSKLDSSKYSVVLKV